MSGDTPIYDATCRAVGPPPGTDRTSAGVIDDARPSSPEVDDAHAGTSWSEPGAPPVDPRPYSPGDDPSTSELLIPGDALDARPGGV